MNKCNLLTTRRAGILLHPTSLPGPYELGDIGFHANKFVDFLHETGVSAWQVLPLSPTHSDLSPYGTYSAHAGNPNLISLEKLCDKGWLDKKNINDYSTNSINFKSRCLISAYFYFINKAPEQDLHLFHEFKARQKYWIDDYALYVCFRNHFNHSSWIKWPVEYRERSVKLLEDFSRRNKLALDVQKFIQFVFLLQWTELKSYANERNIIVIGDIPIFVALDSADVWANREYFSVDELGNPIFVAGVPPDYFSETGQRWGNPLYRWDNIQRDGYIWWLQRIKTQHTLFDVIRIDHFRGLAQYWEIPAAECTAQAGRWVPAPGKELLATINNHFPNTCLVAEDLGTITQDVDQLRAEFNIPGMRVLQFAFDGNEYNPHLPCNYEENSIAYTATHDNNTTIGWYNSLSYDTKRYVMEVIDHFKKPIPWPLIHATLASASNTAIIPMQDILELGETCRMNTPGTINDQNWRWRFDWNQIKIDTKIYLSNLIKFYNRIGN